MISYAEAIEKILSLRNIIVLKISKKPLTECLGATLAEDIAADVDFPSFDNSAMDGYAIKYQSGKNDWFVTGEISAGNFIDGIKVGDDAVSITTGSRLPEDADTIIPVENVIRNGNSIFLKETRDYNKGDHVRFKGSYLDKVSLALPKNTVLSPNNISLAAACGRRTLEVFEPLKICIFSTGDELIEFSHYPEGDKIRSTNTLTMTLLSLNSGMIPIALPDARDDAGVINSTLESALNTDCDIIITCGGVSVGEHDYVQEALRDSGAEIVFWKVNIKPGKPFLFSILIKNGRTIPVFSFPGNPVSVFVNYKIFLEPFINLLYNREKQKMMCTLSDDLIKKDAKRHFVTGKYEYSETLSGNIVIDIKGKSSGDQVSLGSGNCLIVFPEDRTILQKGEQVECIKI